MESVSENGDTFPSPDENGDTFSSPGGMNGHMPPRTSRPSMLAGMSGKDRRSVKSGSPRITMIRRGTATAEGADDLNSTTPGEIEIFRSFDGYDATTNTVPKKSVIDFIEATGLRFDSLLLSSAAEFLADEVKGDILSAAQFSVFARQSSLVATKALMGNLIFPDFPAFRKEIDSIHEVVKPQDSGHVATYIPQLGRVDPNQFGIAVCSVDGQRHGVGDYKTYFCIQSCCKPITYGLGLEEAIQSFDGDAQKGEDFVHAHVGCEPSGRGFNERVLNPKNLPHNPCINSGAIMCASLVKRKDAIADRFDYVMDKWDELSGRIAPIGFANSTYLSEAATADRNFCLAYMMKEKDAFPEGTDLVKTLEFYFMMCSIEMTCEQMSIVASTLANDGICPVTGVRIFDETAVRNILSVAAACGMYDSSGSFAFKIGFPAKSGVGGCIFLVIPGKMGMAIWSPNLDKQGNSVRGQIVCQELVSRFSFHKYDGLTGGQPSDKINPIKSDDDVLNSFENFLWACARGDMTRLRHLFAKGEIDTNVSDGDYDGRTGLHLAAAHGHTHLVHFLLLHGASPTVKDRFGDTPIEVARKARFDDWDDCAVLMERPPYAIYLVESSGPEAFETRVFGAIDQKGDGKVLPSVVLDILKEEGFTNESSPHLNELFKILRSIQDLDEKSLGELLKKFPVLEAAICGDQTIQDFGNFSKVVNEIYAKVEPNHSGDVADYIPALASANPDKYGISVCSLTGQQLDVGDSNVRFAMQSMCKVINYCIAQKELGVDKVHTHVGREPSGQLFNEICLDDSNLPHNPCINAGAIMTVSLIKPDMPVANRLAFIESYWTDLTGGRKPSLNAEMFLGERATADRNFCLAYYMKGAGAFPDWIKSGDDLNTILELYFMTCSLEITTEEMAVVAATLANGGTNPLTGKQIFPPDVVRNALTIMASCGMYDGSGDFAFRIGLPTKSGVGGGLMIVVPGKMGICTFSPRLDECGNSVRGCDTCAELTQRFNLHVYDEFVRGGRAKGKIDPTIYGGSKCDIYAIQLSDAAAANDLPAMDYLILGMGVDPSVCDYDSRTPLHLAAASGSREAAENLLKKGANPLLKDRWGKTPLDCVKGGPENEKLMSLFMKYIPVTPI